MPLYNRKIDEESFLRVLNDNGPLSWADFMQGDFFEQMHPHSNEAGSLQILLYGALNEGTVDETDGAPRQFFITDQGKAKLAHYDTILKRKIHARLEAENLERIELEIKGLTVEQAKSTIKLNEVQIKASKENKMFAVINLIIGLINICLLIYQLNKPGR